MLSKPPGNTFPNWVYLAPFSSLSVVYSMQLLPSDCLTVLFTPHGICLGRLWNMLDSMYTSESDGTGCGMTISQIISK